MEVDRSHREYPSKTLQGQVNQITLHVVKICLIVEEAKEVCHNIVMCNVVTVYTIHHYNYNTLFIYNFFFHSSRFYSWVAISLFRLSWLMSVTIIFRVHTAVAHNNGSRAKHLAQIIINSRSPREDRDLASVYSVP